MSQHKRVLLVDDDEDQRIAIRYALSKRVGDVTIFQKAEKRLRDWVMEPLTRACLISTSKRGTAN